jgi:hypothetical protein
MIVVSDTPLIKDQDNSNKDSDETKRYASSHP